MKKRFGIFNLLLVLVLFVTINAAGIAQTPPPPPNGGHGAAGNKDPGGGAPIGEGMFLLIGLAGMYGCKKVFDYRKEVKSA
ncbi:MAG: hypothetical protein WCI92_02245 [Bacteroidota bacterium]